jgi:hypothetical protein
MLPPVSGQRIVARFGCEGKPDNARKSRIFNNLGPGFDSGMARAFQIDRRADARDRRPAVGS